MPKLYDITMLQNQKELLDSNVAFTSDQLKVIQLLMTMTAKQVATTILENKPQRNHSRTVLPINTKENPNAFVPDASIFPDDTSLDLSIVNGTVDPIRDLEDIDRMAQYLRNQPGRFAMRNYLFFVMGCNTGLRASDIAVLRFGDVLNDDGSVKKELGFGHGTRERKTGKIRKTWLNKTVEDAILEYAAANPGYRMVDFLFPSQKSISKPIGRNSMGIIIKNAARELGIPGNICTHSMRKSWAYHVFMGHQQTPEVLAYLQDALNHTSPTITFRYLGISDDRKRELFMDTNLGGGKTSLSQSC